MRRQFLSCFPMVNTKPVSQLQWQLPPRLQIARSNLRPVRICRNPVRIKLFWAGQSSQAVQAGSLANCLVKSRTGSSCRNTPLYPLDSHARDKSVQLVRLGPNRGSKWGGGQASKCDKHAVNHWGWAILGNTMLAYTRNFGAASWVRMWTRDKPDRFTLSSLWTFHSRGQVICRVVFVPGCEDVEKLRNLGFLGLNLPVLWLSCAGQFRSTPSPSRA